MHLDQVITVFCTDHETQKKGKIIRIYSSGIDVEVSGTIIKLKVQYPLICDQTRIGYKTLIPDMNWLTFSFRCCLISFTLCNLHVQFSTMACVDL